MKKIALLVFSLTLWLPVVAAEQSFKQNTINDFLQQEKIKAKKHGRKTNSLIYETSPYLLQHAYNPVEWYSWGDAAFEKAKKENKPIFLSIGYSTCHWCHVMAHESFENKEIAAYLNKYFVSIKVDREQRPDIDAVYMSATQLINGHGGWPMTVFLDHQLRPFHAATYYPPYATDRRDGLKEVLQKIHNLWKKQPELINNVASNITSRIKESADDTTASEKLANDIEFLALKQISLSFDEDFGGFSVAPKFPRPGIFALLNALPSDSSKAMMKKTLDAMLAGGIYDQIGGGFHRYSVDESWQVPHFEKMLYSQALMVMAYSDFYRTQPDSNYKRIVSETLSFVTREMRSPSGGFYSALDADSERDDAPGVHAEGAYYLWNEAELKKVLNKEDFNFIQPYFDIRINGNIISDPQQEFTGLNIFYIDEESREEALTLQQNKKLITIKEILNEIRLTRPRPHLDDKIITAWNGMMLSAYANASQVFEEPKYLANAIQALDFINAHLYDDKTNQLYRQYRAGQASTQAGLADYVWLINGLLKVFQISEENRWFDWALILQKQQDKLFLDKSSGAYFDSVANDSSVLFRSKNIYDGALPSANAIALSNLRVFSRITKKSVQNKYSLQADKLVGSFASVVNKTPAAASMLLSVELQKIAR